jgi:hypothetical protein
MKFGLGIRTERTVQISEISLQSRAGCMGARRLWQSRPAQCRYGKGITLDLVKSGRACRREMKFHIGIGLEPILILLDTIGDTCPECAPGAG